MAATITRTSKPPGSWGTVTDRAHGTTPVKDHSDTPPQQQIPLPKRLPQPTGPQGTLIALTVIGAWAAVYLHGLLQVKLSGPDRSSLLHIAAVFFSLEYLFTGLFITAHDAMHGTIAPKNRRLNNALGRIAIGLYGQFDYRMLHKKHWEHHDHTGRVGEDPDFHHGDPTVWKWYLDFIIAYSTVGQYLKVFAENFAVWLLLGVPLVNILLFKVAAMLLSSMRLFYFGTYVPHHPTHAAEVMPWEKSRSAECSRLASTLRCYCFDYHWEHHKWPHAPWWQLGDYKALVRKGKIATA